MLLHYRGVTLLAGCLALTLTAAGCGKKENPGTVDTGSGATASTAVRISGVKLGRALGPDKRLTNETDEFRPADVIYAVVETRGTAPNTALQARWTYQDGQVVDESSRNITPTGEDLTEFHIAKPSGWPAGKYTVQILLNGSPGESKDFKVK